MSRQPTPIEQFDDLLARFDHAILVTIAGDGSLHARPMAIAARQDGEEGGKLYFATSSASAKAGEIAGLPRVAVTMQAEGVYLAVSGMATLVADPPRVRALWQKPWKLWFPDGPEDPRLVLLEVEPERAEYWDRTGMRRIEFLWEAGKAIAGGRAIDDDRLSGHGKVSFG